jgi:hypothetical protein
MLKVQVFANNVKTTASQAREKFFRAKTRHEDFNYLPMNSRLPPANVRGVAVAVVVMGSKSFTRFVYEQK